MKVPKNKIVVGISQGDINGISYEVIIKTLLDNRILELCTPIVYGSPKIAAYHRKTLNISNFSLNNIRTPNEANHKRPNVINCVDDNTRVELGKSTSMAGMASFQALERAVTDLKNELIDVLVTAPINKYNIQSGEFNFPGHTEYLARHFDSSGKELMLMIGDNLRVAVVSTHVPIRDVPKYITKENVLNKLQILNHTLIQDFAIRKPCIAVLGLNPHSGDHGIIGDEEKNIIIPTIEEARKQNIMALGPYSADGFFGSVNFKKFDAILAMYHDQGLTPFKALIFDKGVNYTAGLPIIRTSPAHGTAYGIAGEGKATPESMRNAVYLACDIYKNRKNYNELIEEALDTNVQKDAVNDENENNHTPDCQ